MSDYTHVDNGCTVLITGPEGTWVKLHDGINSEDTFAVALIRQQAADLAAARAEVERLRPAVDLLRTADAEIERLTERVAALTADNDDCIQDRARVVNDLFTAKAALAATQAELAAALPDAARYRSISRWASSCLIGYGIQDDPPHERHWTIAIPTLTGETIDAAIDAAIAKEAK